MEYDIQPSGNSVDLPPCKAVRLATDTHSLNFYTKLIKPGDLVFDVGANVGVRTMAFLMLGAEVVAFEPQSSVIPKLEGFKDLPQYALEPIALGAEPGTAKMNLCTTDMVSSLADFWSTKSRFADREWIGSEEVKVDTLDRQIEKYGVPKYIKIDVEGYELEVLKGLSTEVPCLSIEFTAEIRELSEACLEHIGGLYDAEYQFVGEENRFFSFLEWATAEQMSQFMEYISRQNPKAWGDIYVRSKRLAAPKVAENTD